MTKGLQWKIATLVLIVAGLAAFPRVCTASDDAAAGDAPKAAADSGLYIKVQLAHPVKMSRLKTGDVVEGSLSRDVYSSDRKMFSVGQPGPADGGSFGEEEARSQRPLALGRECVHSSS